MEPFHSHAHYKFISIKWMLYSEYYMHLYRTLSENVRETEQEFVILPISVMTGNRRTKPSNMDDAKCTPM